MGHLKLVYLVFAHKNPSQLARLVGKLMDSQTVFYVYVDGKADLAVFKKALKSLPLNQIIWVEKRKSITWADFTLASAYLECFELILKQQPLADFIITISGQDYPIVSTEAIQQKYSTYRDFSIMDNALVTSDSPHIIERVEQYYLSIKRHHCIVYPHPRPNTFRTKLFNRVLKLSNLYPMPRQFPINHQLYFGTNWFQLKPIAVQYIVNFAKSNPKYVQFFRTTFAPEEAFFHTILANATEEQRGKIHTERLTYMQWDRPEGSYPSPISIEEVDSMLESGKIYARKFEAEHDTAILDRIDEYLLANKHLSPSKDN